MASFVVETYVPDGDRERFTLDVDGIRAATLAIDSGSVHHVRSYLVPSDEMGFHVVEAETADDVARLVARAGIEVERVVESVGVMPSRSAPRDRGTRE